MDATIRHEDEPFLDREVWLSSCRMEEMAKWLLEVGAEVGGAGYRLTLEQAGSNVYLRVRAYRPAASTTGSHLDVYGGC